MRTKMVVGGCEGTGGAQSKGWDGSSLFGGVAVDFVWEGGGSARQECGNARVRGIEAFFPHSLLEQCFTSPGGKSPTQPR